MIFSASFRAAFTLIELLVVIAIVAVISVVVILTLNPAEILRQARDSTRLSDLGTINKAIGIYRVDLSGGSTGSANTVYVSIPDTSSTCTNLGLPSLPSGWAYKCVSQQNLRNVDGTGWIPIDFTGISIRPPLGSLPVDPTNTVSSGYYYTYVTGGSWALSSLLESDKYLKKLGLNDGGYDPARYEIGTRLSLIAQSKGLVGWWRFEETSGTSAADSSGNSNTATYQGSPVMNQSGKMGDTIRFDGIDDYVNFPAGVPSNLQIGGPVTLEAWIKTTKSDHADAGIIGYGISANQQMVLHFSTFYFYMRKSGEINDLTYSSATHYDGNWHHFVATWDGTTNANGMKIYMDGELRAQKTSITAVTGAWPNLQVGSASNFFNGWIDEARIYSRALSAAEILAMYNATK